MNEKLSLIHGKQGLIAAFSDIAYEQDWWDGDTCASCIYYFKIMKKGVMVAGQCRRFPPTPMVVPGAVAGTGQIQGVHPPVSEDWVCGEHMPATEG